MTSRESRDRATGTTGNQPSYSTTPHFGGNARAHLNVVLVALLGLLVVHLRLLHNGLVLFLRHGGGMQTAGTDSGGRHVLGETRESCARWLARTLDRGPWENTNVGAQP